jgi:hypothetical protein
MGCKVVVKSWRRLRRVSFGNSAAVVLSRPCGGLCAQRPLLPTQCQRSGSWLFSKAHNWGPGKATTLEENIKEQRHWKNALLEDSE